MTTPVEIPIALDVPLYTERVTLDGIEYVLAFDWNDREQRWYLGISDLAGNPIIARIKLIENWPLLRHYRARAGLPPGELFAYGPNAPEFADLGRSVTLVYVPANA